MITPAEFKSRFIALLPPVPPDLDLSLDEFAVFPKDRAASLRIADADRAFLTECGLPVDAAPFLNFGLDAERALAPLDGFPDSAIIGSNNNGDAICIDQSDGAVVYYNHDDNMRRVFMNSSLALFAQSLCAFSALMRSKDAGAFREEVSRIDPPALMPGAFWLIEMEGTLAR